MRVDERQKAGIAIVSLFYVIGYMVGRAGGRADFAREVLNANGTHRA